MNTYLAKYLLIICSVLSISSCNEKSVIEGVNTKPVVNIIDTTISAYQLYGSPIYANMNIDGNIVAIGVQTSFGLGIMGFPGDEYLATDSLRSTQLSLQGNLSFYYGSWSKQIRKYNKGDTMSGGTPLTSTIPSLIFAKRSAPFTTANKFVKVPGKNYNPLTRNFADTSINGFGPLSDGYVMFKAVQSGVTSITYYGWIHVIVNQNSVTLDKYGFQPMKALKAGAED